MLDGSVKNGTGYFPKLRYRPFAERKSGIPDAIYNELSGQQNGIHTTRNTSSRNYSNIAKTTSFQAIYQLFNSKTRLHFILSITFKKLLYHCFKSLGKERMTHFLTRFLTIIFIAFHFHFIYHSSNVLNYYFTSGAKNAISITSIVYTMFSIYEKTRKEQRITLRVICQLFRGQLLTTIKTTPFRCIYAFNRLNYSHTINIKILVDTVYYMITTVLLLEI